MILLFLTVVVVTTRAASPPRPKFSLFQYDPTGAQSHLHLLGETATDFFSLSHPDERCAALASFAPDPQSRVKFSQFRENTQPVPTRTYLGPCPATSHAFAYLNSSIAGKVHKNSFVYNCTTDEYIPDDSLTAVPHARNQSCVFSVRLRPERTQDEAVAETAVSGAVFKYKQLVSHGFYTKFTFILSTHRAADMPAFSTRQAARLSAQFADDLFYFSIFNTDELWTSLSPTSFVPSAVYVGVSLRWISVYRTRPDSPDLELLARSSTDAFPLQLSNQQEHHIHVKYNLDFSAEEVYAGISIEPSYYADLQKAKRLGLLTLSLDGRTILATVLDLAEIVRVDSVTTFEFAAPTYDEARPGSAWTGFLIQPLSRNAEDEDAAPIPAVDIVSWDFIPTPRCPGDSDGPISCTVTGGVSSSAADLKFSVRNVGKTSISLGARFASKAGVLSVRCGNGDLDWDPQHNYFLGCEREVSMSGDVQELLISDNAQLRSLVVSMATSDFRQDRAASLFKRRSIARYCVVEHAHDLFRFYFAQCDCEYCARVFDLMQLYSVFKSQMCGARFGLICNCFEVSQMTNEPFDSPWTMLGPVGGLTQGQPLMSFQKHTVCVGCKYDSHCNNVFKHGLCVGNTARQYRVGNPLVPDIFHPGFQSWTRDQGRVTDGLIKGDVCDCKDGGGQVNAYSDTRGFTQTNEVYLMRTLQSTRDACFACLQLFEGAYCAVECGPSTRVSYLTHPNGQGCATCALSGVKLFELNSLDRTQVVDCFYEATAGGLDPWTHCDQIAASLPPIYASTSDLFNGVATHFLTECPGRDFDVFGAVCAPNVEASKYLTSQILSRSSAIKNTVWGDEVACVNAACNLVPRTKCYDRLIDLSFSSSPQTSTPTCTDRMGSGVECVFENEPIGSPAGLSFNKTNLQYGYSTSIPNDFDLKTLGKTLEVWTIIDPSDDVVDMANDAYQRRGESAGTASSLWSDDYAPSKAVDGNLTTFWASNVSVIPVFNSSLEVDLGSVLHVGSVDILWGDYAIDFIVEISSDGITWRTVATFLENSNNVTAVDAFFAAAKIRVSMTKASGVRGPGPNQGMFIYSIKELIVSKDLVITHLRPVTAAQGDGLRFPATLAIDGDRSTRFMLPFAWQQSFGGDAKFTVKLGSVGIVDAVYFRFFGVVNAFSLTFDAIPFFDPARNQPQSLTCSFTLGQDANCGTDAALFPRGATDFVYTLRSGAVLNSFTVSFAQTLSAGFGIAEIEAFGKSKIVDVLAAGGSFSASSSTNASKAPMAFDGDFVTSWIANSYPSSLLVDAGICLPASSVDLMLLGLQGSVSMSVLASADCQVFAEIKSSTSLAAGAAPFIFDASLTAAVPCVRCVRVDLAGAAGSYIEVSEVFFSKKITPPVQLTSSSFINEQLALDADPSTSAAASGSAHDHIKLVVMSTGGEKRNIWGYEVELQPATGSASHAVRNVTMSYCTNSMTLSTCIWIQLHRQTGLTDDTRKVFVVLPDVVSAYSVMLEFESQTITGSGGSSFLLSSLDILDGPNIIASSGASATSSVGHWDHPSSALVDGNYSTLYAVNGSLTNDIVITIATDLNKPLFAQNVAVNFDGVSEHIGKNFDVFISTDGFSFNLVSRTLNLTAATFFAELKTFCSVIKLSFSPASPNQPSLGGGSSDFDNYYGIRKVDVIMSSSAQVGRSIWAQSTVDPAMYQPENAIDGDENTIFLHNPGKLPSLTEFSMPRRLAVSGINFKWMNAPVSYSVEYVSSQDSVTGAKVWATAGGFKDIGSDSIFFEQAMRDGFTSQFLRLNISDVKPYIYAPVAALREMIVYTPSFPCDRWTCPCCFVTPQASDYSVAPSRAFDGDLLTVWQTDASLNLITGYVAAGVSGSRIGKIEIHWGTLVPRKFQLIFDTSDGSRVDHYVYHNNTAAYFEKYLLYDVNLVTVMLLEAWPGDRFFQIKEVVVWAASTDVPVDSVVHNSEYEFTSSISNAIDLTSSFWMSRPTETPGTVLLDLQEVVKISGFQLIWSLRPTFYNDDMFSYSLDNVRWTPLFTEIRPEQPEIEDFNEEIELRYLRIYLSSSYSDDTGMAMPVWSVGIRNLDLKLDINLAKRQPATAPQGSWAFPPSWSIDRDDSTYWMSRFGALESTLTIDFGEEMNMAGGELDMVYRARFVEFAISTNPECSSNNAGGSFTSIYAVSGNQENVVRMPSTIQGRARCIRAFFQGPIDSITNPQGGDPQGVLAVRRFTVSNHKGGGGVFGIEECSTDSVTQKVVCGRKFDTITYALSQPQRWEVASEGFARTEEIADVRVLESVSQLVQIVAVFDESTVTLYRNGLPYGAPYTHTSSHLTQPSEPGSFLRLVFGIRSSAFIGESTIGEYSASVLEISGPPTSQSQYFSGVVKSVSLIKGALLGEEILGLYEAGLSGGTERSCHCADACPFGFNALYPTIPIPCSGQGVCRRAASKLATSAGFCLCSPGYSGASCEHHCSQLGGCCNIDDDCEPGRHCDAALTACVASN